MIDLPPPYEKIGKERLEELQTQIAVYNETEQRGDAAATEEEAQRVASAMRNVGDSQKDPKVKKEWYRRSEKFTRAANSARKGITKEVESTVIGILSIPFRVAGTVLSIAGGILHGVGGLLVGVGDVVKGGSDRMTNAVAGSSRDGGNVGPAEDNGNPGSAKKTRSKPDTGSLGDNKASRRDT
ncbi:hypothetical protein BDZ94DRAFT_1257321 [Collybia nuda]|uniref:Uncharacterized protein n=1 Tax=Collybia nuda TaxID=64659 RepID=A0A9P5YA75_9AGAR|nr:hypothetical protein BDZ94DRAFT_1257321 [Collybia nuda]